MKSFKILKTFLFGLILSPLIYSFCSAGVVQYDFTLPAGTYTHGKTIFYLPFPLKNVNVSQHEFDYSCEFSSFNGSYGGNVYYMFQYNGIQFNNQDYNKISNWSLKIFNSTSSLSTIFNSNGGIFTGHANIKKNISTYMLGSFNFYNDGIFDLVLNSPLSVSCIFSGNNILNSSCPTCPSQYTSEECQTEYDLIPSSDLSICNNNLQSCQTALSGWDNTLNNCSNNLLSCQSSLSSCIAGNCPLDNGDNVQWSSLFINNIQHIGAPLININIPEEFDWDYSYYTGEFNLDIEGYNTDSDYIAGIITTQNSKPSQEDLNNIISGVLPLFVPGLVIILFIYFVFRLLKKIF